MTQRAPMLSPLTVLTDIIHCYGVLSEKKLYRGVTRVLIFCNKQVVDNDRQFINAKYNIRNNYIL